MTATFTIPLAPATTRRARSYAPGGDVGRRLAAAQSLQRQIQEIEAELSIHREWFLRHMRTQDLHTVTGGDFTVQRKTRHHWTYSPEAEREALALRSRQKWEQAQGIATDTPRDYVAFTTQTTPAA